MDGCFIPSAAAFAYPFHGSYTLTYSRLLPLQMLRAAFLLPRSTFSFSSFSRICFCKMSTTTPGPLIPTFIPIEQSEIRSVSEPNGYRFSLVSYNILAQVYVKSSLFPHSPAPCLKWKARSQAILTVLKNLNSDFLCLQEVDEYESFYKENMERLGYSSIYVQRDGIKRDGCGIFYKPTSAELVLNAEIHYNDLVNSVPCNSTSDADKDGDAVESANVDDKLKKGSEPQSTQRDLGDPNDPRVRLKRDCVGVLALFKLRNPYCHHLILANTHIYWDPEWADVKLAQVKYLLSRLAQFKTMVSDKFGCTPSVIVAGDFNSIPGDQVYQYLVSGSSSTGSILSETIEEQPLPLNSLYAYTRGEEPQFTNCTPGFTGTLDYILFSSTDDGIVKPVSYLQIPEPEAADVDGGLPNYYHPSDHLPIGAEFEVLNA